MPSNLPAADATLHAKVNSTPENYGLRYLDRPSEDESEESEDDMDLNSCANDCCDRDCECDDCTRCSDSGTVGEEDSILFRAAAG